MDPTQLANSFVEFYYGQFCTKATRPQVCAAYLPTAVVLYNDKQISGIQEITEYFTNKVSFETMAIQNPIVKAVSTQNGVLVSVSGKLMLDGAQPEFFFSHSFALVPQNGSFFIEAEIFNITM